jgi:2-keto-4-pentenoate hydratase/2-oxohepta-3-ene-1,7-dioic acid hydratase in catechol pathway
MQVARAEIDGVLTYGQIREDQFYPQNGDLFSGLVRAGTEPVDVSNLRLLEPLAPARVFAVLHGFPDSECSQRPYPTTRFCAKYAAHPTGDLGEVVVPEWLATPIWAEAELGVVIGSPVYNASQDAARQAIFGFTIVNDATAPALFDKNNFFLAKSVETFLSLGPSIETDLSEDDVMRGLEITTLVNGKEAQRGNTGDFRWPPSAVVQHVSKVMSLIPGDVIALGTPPPPAEVTTGDEIQFTIERIGTLHNSVVAARIPAASEDR